MTIFIREAAQERLIRENADASASLEPAQRIYEVVDRTGKLAVPQALAAGEEVGDTIPND